MKGKLYPSRSLGSDCLDPMWILVGQHENLEMALKNTTRGTYDFAGRCVSTVANVSPHSSEL